MFPVQDVKHMSLSSFQEASILTVGSAPALFPQCRNLIGPSWRRPL